MRGGELRHSGILERPATTLGTRGERVTTWEVVVDKWRCAVKQAAGKEGDLARRLFADATHLVTGRWVPGVTVECRLRIGNRVFGIGSVENVEERGVEMKLTVAEALN